MSRRESSDGLASARLPSAQPAPRRGFGGHILAQAAGATNDNLFRQAFMIVVTTGAVGIAVGEQAESTATMWKTYLALIFIIPFLLLAPLAGRLADTWPKHRLIRLLRCCEPAICLIAGAALVTDAAWLMLVALALLGVQSALFAPVKLAVVPELVTPAKVDEANGLLTSTTYLAIMLGNGLAFVADDALWHGTWLAGLGGAGVLTLVSLVISGLGIAGAWRLPRLQPGGDGAARASFGEQFRSLSSAGGLWEAALALAAVWGIGLLAQLALVGVAVFNFGFSEAQAALLALVPMIGVAIGGLLAPRLSHRAYPGGLPIVGAICFGLGAIAAAAAAVEEDLWLTCAGLLLSGLGIAAWTVPLNIFLQTQAPLAQRGRVFAAAGILSILAILVASGINFLGGYFSVPSAGLLALAGGISLTGAIACLVPYRFHFTTWVATMLTRFFYKVRVIGIEHLPREGGCLLVCNHVSYADGVVVFANLPRQARYLIYRRYVDMPVVGMPLRGAGAIAIDGGGSLRALRQSIDAAVEAAAGGDLVVIFPEGKITRSGQLDRFQSGCERIARRAGVPILPAHLHGLLGSLTSRCGRRHGPYFRRPVELRLGRPCPSDTPAQEVRAMVRRLAFEAASDRAAQDTRTLPSAFLQQMRRKPGQTAVIDSGGSLTRLKLAAAAHAIRPLLGLGDDEQRVGVLLPPGRAGAVVNLAIAMTGRSAVNLNHTAGEAALADMAERAGLQTIITSSLYRRKIGEPALPGRVLTAEDLLGGLTNWKRLRSALAVRFLPIGRLVQARPDDEACIVFSSGSTSQPKGAQLTHRQILANITAVADHLHLKDDDVVLSPLPLFHSFGLTVGDWLPLTLGLTVANHPDPTDGAAIGKLAAQARASFFVATPTFVRGWMRRIEPEQFAHLRFGVVGAERCPEDLRKQFRQRYDAELLEGYGATELGPVVSVNTLDVERDGVHERGAKDGSIGRPLPGIDIVTLDPETREPLPVGEEGLLIVRSPARMLGYLDDPERTASVFVDDGYDTGDIGHVDEDGFVFITGRLARFAKIGGEMIPLDKIEGRFADALQRAYPDWEDDLALCAVADERRGERLVLLHTGLPCEPGELLRLAEDLPAIQKPKERDVHQVDEIPVLGSGKRDIKKLNDLAQSLAQH